MVLPISFPGCEREDRGAVRGLDGARSQRRARLKILSYKLRGPPSETFTLVLSVMREIKKQCKHILVSVRYAVRKNTYNSVSL